MTGVDPIQRTPFAESVRQPERLTSVPSDKQDAKGQPLRVGCVTCHSLRAPSKLPPSMGALTAFHGSKDGTHLTLQHGTLTCGYCHVEGDPLKVHLATGAPIPMEDALALCAQCHGPQYRDFKHRAHGGVNGYWDETRGPKTRNHCVDCHDPHSPAVPQVTPVFPPVYAHGAATSGSHKSSDPSPAKDHP
jgi:formate-dependent nitrite reductase cytochrome c552 subunit